MHTTHDKLSMPLRYIHYAHVTGRGAFPIDMLRYDRAAPRHEQDSQLIEASFLGGFETRTMELVTYSCYAHANAPGVWTPARWNSFAWTLTPGIALVLE